MFIFYCYGSAQDRWMEHKGVSDARFSITILYNEGNEQLLKAWNLLALGISISDPGSCFRGALETTLTISHQRIVAGREFSLVHREPK